MATDRPARNGSMNSDSTDGLNRSAHSSARGHSRSQAGGGMPLPAQRHMASQRTLSVRRSRIPTRLKSLSLEAALDELDRITAALEESHRPLEESLALYERGVRLVQHSQELLDSAGLRLQRLRPASADDDYDARSGFALDDFELDEE